MSEFNEPDYSKDERGKWRWTQTANNGEIIGASTQGFASKQKAQENYALVLKYGLRETVDEMGVEVGE